MKATEIYRGTLARLDGAFTVELLASGLVEGEGLLRQPLGDEHIGAAARRNGFSQVLLRGSVGPEIREVACVRSRPVRISRRGVCAADLVAAETPIGEGINYLAGRSFSLVLKYGEVVGILTRADFNKLPVRSYVLTLLMRLEAVMDEAIEREWPKERWLNLVGATGIEKINQIHTERKRGGRELPLVSCASFAQKFSLCRRSEGLAKLFEETEREMGKSVRELPSLRNDVAHVVDLVRGPADDGAGGGRTPPDGFQQGMQRLRSQVQGIRRLVDGIAQFLDR